MKTSKFYLYTNIALLETYLTRCAVFPDFAARREYISLAACANGAIMLTHEKLSRQNVLSTCQNGKINPVIAEIDLGGFDGGCTLIDAGYSAAAGALSDYDPKKHLCLLLPSAIPTSRIVKVWGVEQNLNFNVYGDLYLPDALVSSRKFTFGKASVDPDKLCSAAESLSDVSRQIFLADKLRGAMLGFCGNCRITLPKFSSNADGNIFAMMSKDSAATLTAFLQSKDRYGGEYSETKGHSLDPSADPYVYDIKTLLKTAFSGVGDAKALALSHGSFKEGNVCLLLYCAICACRDLEAASYKSVDAEQWIADVSAAFLKMREGCWQPEEDERVNLFAGIENLFGAGFSRISAILDGSASKKQYSPLKTLLFFGANITNSLRNLTANALHFGLSVFETSLAKMLYGLCYGAGVFDKAYKSDLTLVRVADEIAAEMLTGIVPPFDKAKFRAVFKLPADAEYTDRGFRIVYRDDAYVENAVMEHVRSAITASGVDPALFILTLPSANARTAFGQILKTQQKRSGKSRRKKESETDAPPADKHKKAANTADPAQMTIFDQLDKETENGTEA